MHVCMQVTKSVLETGGSGIMSSSSAVGSAKRRLFKSDVTVQSSSADTSLIRSNNTSLLGPGGDDEQSGVATSLTSEQMIEQLVDAAVQLTSKEQLTSINMIEKLVDEVSLVVAI